MDVPPHRIPRRAFSRIYDLRPRLAVLAALLDDWASRPLHHYLPKWNIDDDDDEIFPRRPPFELRRSCSARKPDDGLYWMFDDELLMAGRGKENGTWSSHGLRRSQTHASRRPRSVDELRSLRRQYFEGFESRDDQFENDEGHPSPVKSERPVPLSVHMRGSRTNTWAPPDGPPNPNDTSCSRPRGESAGSPLVRSPAERVEADGCPTTKPSTPAKVEEVSSQLHEKKSSGEPWADGVAGMDPTGGGSKEQPQQQTRTICIDLSDSYKDLRASTLPCGKGLPSQDKETALSDGAMVSLSLVESERRATRELREENVRLKAVITNLQEVNKRWQTFNADRQMYVQRLLTTIEEQQTQLNACLDALSDSRPAPSCPHRSVPHTHPEPDYLEIDKLARLRSLQRDVAELQRRLDEAREEHRETVAVLQMQSEVTTRSFGGDTVTNRTTEQHDENGTWVSSGSCPEQNKPAPGRDRTASPYSFTGEALSSLCGQQRARGPVQRQTESPSLSDALTPTPTPTPQQQPNYPVELSGSASSLASLSGPAPHVSIPSSSRASSPDPDASICSDMTLDCSPPSPVQGTLTVGFNSSGLANVTSFNLRPVLLSPVPGSPDIDELMMDDVEVTRLSARSDLRPRDSRSSAHTRDTDLWRIGAHRNSCEDVICPTCGDVFPPTWHLQFLDHFEVCANKPPRQRR